LPLLLEPKILKSADILQQVEWRSARSQSIFTRLRLRG
jgi:hypothetical protein